MNKFLSLLLAVFAFAACEKGDGGSDAVKLAEGTSTTQTVYADETAKPDGIKFTASAEWYAEVDAVTSKAGDSRIDWLELSQYSGGKGDFTLTLTLLTNTTGSDRKAAIRIVCGETTITVTVEQKATTETGEIPLPETPTYDDQEPYVRFETEEILLPASLNGPLEITLRTNMLEPVIAILPAVETDNIAAVKEFQRPDPGNEGNSRLLLDVFPNTEDRTRTAEMQFQTFSGEVVQSVVLKQQPAAVCQILEKQAEVGRLSFKIKANAHTKYVSYGLSEELLYSDDEIDEFFSDRNKIKELELSGEGEKTFGAVIDNLTPATTYYFYLRPGTGPGEGGGALLTEEATTMAQESKHDLVLEVSANPANGFTVYLPFCDNNLKGTVDWGDGTTNSVAGWNAKGVSHKYDITAAATYEVRFSGVLKNISLVTDNRSARENTLLAVKQWGYTGLTHIDLSGFSSLKQVAPDTEGAFRGIEHFGQDPYGGSFTGTGIENIPDGFFDYAVNAASFDYTFGGCEKLKAIPDGLFKNCTKAASFQRTFIECKAIERIPENTFASCREATTFWATFAHCEALEAIPANLFANNAKVISFEGTFSNCTSLTQIPGNLFANSPKALYFGLCKSRDDSYRGGVGVFENCVSLTAIPAGLFAGNSAVKDFSYAFRGCKALTALPQSLFQRNAKLEYLEGTFSGCELLENVPVSIFDANRVLTNVEMLFSQCRKLKGESPYTLINGSKVHLYERSGHNTEFVAIDRYVRCFEGCEELTDYEDIKKVW